MHLIESYHRCLESHLVQVLIIGVEHLRLLLQPGLNILGLGLGPFDDPLGLVAKLISELLVFEGLSYSLERFHFGLHCDLGLLMDRLDLAQLLLISFQVLPLESAYDFNCDLRS